jgi:hypothetical protein
VGDDRTALGMGRRDRQSGVKRGHRPRRQVKRFEFVPVLVAIGVTAALRANRNGSATISGLDAMNAIGCAP